MQAEVLLAVQLDMVVAVDMRALATGLLRKVRALARHRAAAAALHHRYPDAGRELLGQEPCAICRDDMRVTSSPMYFSRPSLS